PSLDLLSILYIFFFSSRRRHTRFSRDWSSDVCSSDLAAVGGGAPGVEAQHRQVGQRGQPVGGLLVDVAVHEAAVGRQRVQRHQGRRRRPVLRQGELADQGQTVAGVQLDRLTPGGQHGGRANLHVAPS